MEISEKEFDMNMVNWVGMHAEEIFWSEPIIPRPLENSEVSLKTSIPRNRKNEEFESLISMIRMDCMAYLHEILS